MITGTIPKQTSKKGAIKRENASLAVKERGAEARTAVRDNKELATNPFSIKHKKRALK